MARRKYKVKYKVSLPKDIEEAIIKTSKKVKPKRKVSIPLTAHSLKKYGKRMTVGDLRKL